MPVCLPTWPLLLALGSGSLGGLVFGTYLAMRASRPDPVEAIRAE